MKREAIILQLRVELAGLRPAIWRTVEVPAAQTLAGFHGVLQILMGWHDAHLWAFEAGGRRFEPPDPDFQGPGAAPEDPEKTRLIDVMPRQGASLQYRYDFGDDWRIDLRVLDLLAPAPKARYPRCSAGERCGPLEDCGGPPGYEQLLDARRHPKGKEARELLKWAGPRWDPEAFDLAAANKALSGLPAPRRLQ